VFATTAPNIKVLAVTDEAVDRKQKLELAMERKRKRLEDALSEIFTGPAVIEAAVQSPGHDEHVRKEASPVETGTKSKTSSKPPKKTTV